MKLDLVAYVLAVLADGVNLDGGLMVNMRTGEMAWQPESKYQMAVRMAHIATL